MIRITVELISAYSGARSTLGVMDICNDGTCDNPKRGSYDGFLWRKGTVNPKTYFFPKDLKPQRTGRVEDYPRESYVVWRLVHKMLNKMFPEEKI